MPKQESWRNDTRASITHYVLSHTSFFLVHCGRRTRNLTSWTTCNTFPLSSGCCNFISTIALRRLGVNNSGTLLPLLPSCHVLISCPHNTLHTIARSHGSWLGVFWSCWSFVLLLLRRDLGGVTWVHLYANQITQFRILGSNSDHPWIKTNLLQSMRKNPTMNGLQAEVGCK